MRITGKERGEIFYSAYYDIGRFPSFQYNNSASPISESHRAGRGESADYCIDSLASSVRSEYCSAYNRFSFRVGAEKSFRDQKPHIRLTVTARNFAACAASVINNPIFIEPQMYSPSGQNRGRMQMAGIRSSISNQQPPLLKKVVE